MKELGPNRRHIRSIMTGLFVLVGFTLLLVLFRDNEPKYKGRTLTDWLQQADAPLSESNQIAEAQAAIRDLGATKSLPILLNRISAKDGPIDSWVLDHSEKFRLEFLHWRSGIECQLYGIAGFEALGSNAAPAVGALTKLLDDNERAFTAARCLENIGKSGESALCKCLTNRNWQVRHFTVSALASVTDDVGVYIARIKSCLNDPEPAVRFATVQAIGVSVCGHIHPPICGLNSPTL